MIGTISLTCAGRQHLAVDAVEPIGVHAPSMVAHVLQLWPRLSTPRWLNITL
jgi:hypothetical protein